MILFATVVNPFKALLPLLWAFLLTVLLEGALFALFRKLTRRMLPVFLLVNLVTNVTLNLALLLLFSLPGLSRPFVERWMLIPVLLILECAVVLVESEVYFRFSLLGERKKTLFFTAIANIVSAALGGGLLLLI